MKKWYTSKTMWIAIVQAVLGTVMMMISQEVAFNALGAMMIAKSAIDAGMRFITNQPIQ